MTRKYFYSLIYYLVGPEKKDNLIEQNCRL